MPGGIKILRTYHAVGKHDMARVVQVLWGYARTYCCSTRGIVLGLSMVGMVGIKGVVGALREGEASGGIGRRG